jgi:hypothetical protein
LCHREILGKGGDFLTDILSQLGVIVQQLGLSLSASALYEIIKTQFSSTNTPTVDGLKTAIKNELEVSGISASADTVIEALAKSGILVIEGSTFYAPNSIIMGSKGSGEMTFGNNSTSRTDKTNIVAGQGATIKTKGNAQVRQNPDGSITFHT